MSAVFVPADTFPNFRHEQEYCRRDGIPLPSLCRETIREILNFRASPRLPLRHVCDSQRRVVDCHPAGFRLFESTILSSATRLMPSSTAGQRF